MHFMFQMGSKIDESTTLGANEDQHGGAGSTTMGTHVDKFWDNRKYRRTVPLDLAGNNVATFQLSPGYQRFYKCCAETGIEDEDYINNPMKQPWFRITSQKMIQKKNQTLSQMKTILTTETLVRSINLDCVI